MEKPAQWQGLLASLNERRAVVGRNLDRVRVLVRLRTARYSARTASAAHA